MIVHHKGHRRKKRIGKDKRLAEKIARQIQAKLVLGEFEMNVPAKVITTFGEFAERWLAAEVVTPFEAGLEGALSRNSMRARCQQVRQHLVPFFESSSVDAIRVADVQSFYEDRLGFRFGKKADRRLSEATIHTIIGTLRRILAYAQAQELVPSNVVDAWKANRGRRRGTGVRPVAADKVLTAEELGTFLTKAQELAADHYSFVLFMADTGCRIGEAIGLRWIDVDLDSGTARIERSVDFTGRVGPTKTRRVRTVELSTRLRAALGAECPDIHGDETPVFPGSKGRFIDSGNFRRRVFRRLVKAAGINPSRRITPHCLRHTFASLHLARGTNLKWVQEAGGWTSAKMLLDVYGHFMPSENRGFADAITAPNGPPAAPTLQRRATNVRSVAPSRRDGNKKVEPTSGFEPLTCSLRVSCSTS